MKLYRLAEIQFSSFPQIFDGIGARKGGGRWNIVDERAVYCAHSAEVCAAELGFHKIISSLPIYDALNLKKEKKLFAKDRLLSQLFGLVEFELIAQDDRVLDLTSDAAISTSLEKLNLVQTITCAELRRSDYYQIPNRYSQMIGSEAASKKYVGLKSLSARSSGTTCILFPQNIPVAAYKIINKHKVILSAVGQNGKTLIPGNPARNDSISFKLGPLPSKLIPILQL